jgi:molybdopterin molybdotransferase
MGLRHKIEAARLSPTAQLHVSAFAGAVGNGIVEQIRHVIEERSERGLRIRDREHARPFLQFGHALRELVEFGTKIARRGRLVRRPCDFAGKPVFVGLQSLDRGQCGAVLLVVAQNFADRRRTETAAKQSVSYAVGIAPYQSDVEHGEPRLMQSVNPVLPGAGFAVERLLPPRQAIFAFFARVSVEAPPIERVSLDDAPGRILAEPIHADADYPNAFRSLMDGFALQARATPGAFEIVDEIRMGAAAGPAIDGSSASRIPTGGVLPKGADAVVPVENARVAGSSLTVETRVVSGENVAEPGGDMRRGETVLQARRRIRASEIGVLATLGVTSIPVYRKPVVAVFSSGDELVAPSLRPDEGQIRDSNRYVVAASLRAMGALPRHYATLRDEADEFEAAIASALRECDAVVVTGGSSVGERDRLPRAVAAIANPGIVVQGLRVKPGKPTLLAADGRKPILGLPGNPTSALMMLEAVAAPIVGALVGAPVVAPTLRARLGAPARSRADWTWYVPVALRDEEEGVIAQPLALRSFSVSLTARADGFIVIDERDEEWPEGTFVTVHRFLECGSCA